jgi:hypothetical protein
MADDMDSRPLKGSHYGYSGTRLDRLGATEYTLVGIAADVSGSVRGFLRDIEACIREIVSACQQAPRADNLMLRLTSFDDTVVEQHGFKPLPACDPASYAGSLNGGGTTALHDASHNAIGAVVDYGRKLAGHGFAVNGLVFVITDGGDNASAVSAEDVARAAADAIAAERVRDLRTVLIGVNVRQASVSRALMDVSAKAAFDAYLELEKADAASLAKLARFATRSIALTSTALQGGSSTAHLSSLTF